MATSLVSVLSTVKDPGRIYRPMFCRSCNGVMYHQVDFIASERSEKGKFVWFTKMCSGTPLAHPLGKLRFSRTCDFAEQNDIPLSQWIALVKGSYF
jgi:hypothetical protein